MPKFMVKASLHTLHCITPTDVSGEDEPFIWTFFVRVDGTTLQPNPASPGSFIPSLTVVARPGGHGNLNVEGVVSGSTFKIPPQLGEFDAELRPVPFTFSAQGQTFQGWIPGRIICFAAVVDEDATSDSIIHALHQEVTQRIQERVNQFVAGLNFLTPVAPIIAQATAVNAGTVQAVTAAVNAFLTAQIGVFRRQITTEIRQLAIEVAVRESVHSQMFFGLVINALDGDELVGVTDVTFSETSLIAANLFATASNNIRQSTAPLGGAWYQMYTWGEGRLWFIPSDVVWVPTSSPASSRLPGSYTPTRSIICVPDGPIAYWRAFIPQTHDLMVTYPFCTYRYSVAGKVLDKVQDTVSFPAEVWIEEFDEGGYPFVKVRSETRTCTVNYRRQPDLLRPQLEHLILQNDPADGSYSFNLRIEAVLPNGSAIRVVEQPLLFEGQEIQFPPGYMESIGKCLEQFTSTKYAKSKRLKPGELWGARAHERRFEEVMQLIEERVSLRSVAPARVEHIRAAVAAAFNRQGSVN